MSVDTESRVRQAVRAFGDAIPVPPGNPTAVIAAGRPRARSRLRLAVPLAAAAVLTVVAAIAVLPGLLRLWTRTATGTASGGAAAAPASLPDRFAGYSYLTGDVSAAPPGRAIALYIHGAGVELLDFPQALVLSA